MAQSLAATGRFHTLWFLLLTLFGMLVQLPAGAALPKPSIKISKAKLAGQNLTIAGSLHNIMTSNVSLYDSSGRLLGQPTVGPDHKFSLTLNTIDHPEQLCSVKAMTSAGSSTVAVSGKPKSCGMEPVCQIISPTSTVTTTLNTNVSFEAKVTFKDRKAQPLQTEWDFGGGSLGEAVPGMPVTYKKATGNKTTVQFVRDNARYRVRFTAWDKQQRYCEDSVEVVVGTPPDALADFQNTLSTVQAMAKTSQQARPTPSQNMKGIAGDNVVLPFEEWTMQGTADSRYTPGGQAVMDTTQNNINAVVYRKDRKPVLLTDANIKLSYSAASNPSDPVAPDSINTTSQNWPLAGDKSLATPMMTATIQKTDVWETTGTAGYKSFTALDNYYVINDPAMGAIPDQGFPIRQDFSHLTSWPSTVLEGGFTYSDPEHGSRMPGFDDPYKTNATQDFTTYLTGQGTFLARRVPITDVDDAGRVNPYPLLQVQATDANSGTPLAASDAVLTAGKDIHCRECHAKGGIAADPKTPWKAAAWHYSTPNWDGTFGGAAEWWTGGATEFSGPPTFYYAKDQNGNPSNNIADQEYAAAMNTASLHDFYDNTALIHDHDSGTGVKPCSGCHKSRITGWVFGGNDENPNSEGIGLTPDKAGPLNADDYFNPDYSRAMHKWHGELQYNADKSGILRDDKGLPKRWNAADGPNPNTLFPTVDAQGNPLPMEQSCLRCHSGHREQLYRDRMYTAGVTCYQCHGDTLAVGKAWPKSRVNPDGLQFRTDWYDQPDCGSCHVGNANVGGGDKDYFSAGVKKLAFSASDYSATPSAVDLNNPDAVRFAVVPYTDLEYTASYAAGGSRANSLWSGGGAAMENFRTPLYREGKDQHGNVPCAACHGGAHSVWPNRDPNANDNVTAQELQGHAGHIDECKVCHTADSFKFEKDLDGERFRTDLATDSGVLGGPHSMHPIYDEYWWKASDNHAPNSDGSTYGGWHNIYAKKPGKAGEDQCAACHGNDHLGTRLSKTPVDRVFDFSSLDKNVFKRAGFKSTVIKVAAGTAIGCNTCHTVKLSCTGSPVGNDVCGQSSNKVVQTFNRPPVFNILPASSGTIGELNTYSVHATDPDGDTVSYSVSRRPDDMHIDEQTGVITTYWPGSLLYWPWTTGNDTPVFTYPYIVTASDGKGGYVTQKITVDLHCYANHLWSGHDCSTTSIGGLTITSKPGTTGLTAGDNYSYQVNVTDSNAVSPAFAVSGQPTGMTIDPNTGLVSWKTDGGAPDKATYQVLVTDSKGGSASQSVSVIVCKSPKQWDGGMGMCM